MAVASGKFPEPLHKISTDVVGVIPEREIARPFGLSRNALIFDAHLGSSPAADPADSIARLS